MSVCTRDRFVPIITQARKGGNLRDGQCSYTKTAPQGGVECPLKGELHVAPTDRLWPHAA
jgi:hypothetical protein